MPPLRSIRCPKIALTPPPVGYCHLDERLIHGRHWRVSRNCPLWLELKTKAVFSKHIAWVRPTLAGRRRNARDAPKAGIQVSILFVRADHLFQSRPDRA